MTMADKPRLSVCIIGQDVAARIQPLLEQASSIADEIVFVDGGSKDGTPELLAKYPKARLVTRAFDGNFAKQKNFALNHARGEWILFLDTDEMVGPNFIRLLPALMASRYTGFNIPRYWLASNDPPRYVDSEKHYPDRQLRLFRNRPELRYDESRPVHEAIPRESRGEVLGLRGAHILHYCFLWEDRAARERKVKRYMESNTSPINNVYLYEEYPHRLRACREGFVHGQTFGGSALDYWIDRIRLWAKEPREAPAPASPVQETKKFKEGQSHA